MHLQGFRKQRSRCFSHHHSGVSAAAAKAAAKTQQFSQGPEESVTTAPARTDWANGPGPHHEEGPSQELRAHVETRYHELKWCIYVNTEIYNKRNLFIAFFFVDCFFFLMYHFCTVEELKQMLHYVIFVAYLNFVFPCLFTYWCYFEKIGKSD